MNANSNIIKEFEKVNAELREQLKELKAEKQSLEQMFQAQRELLNQRHAVVDGWKSDLYIEDGILKPKNGLNTGGIISNSEWKKMMEESSCIDAGYVQYCKERAGEHTEKYLKTINLRQEIDCLRRNNLKKDELIKTLKDDLKEAKKRIGKYNDRHQSDCIEKTQLHTALDVMTEKYQRLREVHGL